MTALSWTLRDEVLEVALHRAPCNEIGTTMLAALEGLVRHLGSARAVVIHSTLPSGFSAGADLRELQAGIAARKGRLGRLAGPLVRREVRRFLDRIHAVFDALDQAPVPVIGAVHGVCFGGGFELALCCDLIVADKSARFAFPELRLGLVPGFGGIPRLERDCGNAVVRDLLLSGRSLGARRAHEIGLVSQVVPRGEALNVARRLADQTLRYAPGVVAAAKRFAKPIPRARLEEEKATFRRLVTHPRVQEALTDFVQRQDVRPYLP